jgi:hypothetical protein
MDDPTEAAQAEGEATPEVLQVEAPATSEDAPKEEAKPAEEKPKRNRRTFEKRIDQLTAQLREAERRLNEKPAESPKTPDAPKREDFADYEEYIEAKAEFKAVQAAEKRLAEVEKTRKQDAERAQETAQQRSFMDARERVLDAGTEKYDDFEAVTTNEDLTITPVMADALLSAEKGDELWYHLGKNPELAEKIAAMHPVKQLMELGRLEATLAVGKRASTAPKPIDPVTSRGSTNNTLSDNLSTKEWMRRRNEEVRKSR